MRCAQCGDDFHDRRGGVTLHMEGGVADRKAFDLCSRCWRDGTSRAPAIPEEPPEQMSTEMVDALRKTGWTEHEVPGQPGVVRMERPSPRERGAAARRAPRQRR